MKWKTPKTAQTLADALKATLHGDPERWLSGIQTLEKAGPEFLSFCTNKQYRPQLEQTQAGLVIISPEELPFCRRDALVVDHPRLALVQMAEWLKAEVKSEPGIHPTAICHESAVIAATATVGPYCVLGPGTVLEDEVVLYPQVVLGRDCRVGRASVLRSRVTCYDQVQIGERVLIHSGVVIGSDGFGFANDEQGQWIKMPHFGGVVIADKVEIGANTTIDAGFIEPTTIGRGVIIDNLVQIAHNVLIGEGTAIAAAVAIAGSTKIGKGCLIGGGARIAGHLDIADGAMITATSAVNRSLHQAGVYSSGFPARPNKQWRRNVARFQYLDQMAKRLARVEKNLNMESES